MKPSVLSCAALALLAVAPVISSACAAAPHRPNILLLVADEYRHDCLGIAGHPIVKTPNFDRLAGEGVRFTRAYAAGPVCSPSRATMFTGRYPNIHGVRGNGYPFNEGEVVLPRLLRARGFTTGIVGKLHLQPQPDWFDFAEITAGGDSASYVAFLRASGQMLKGNANTAAVPESLVAKARTPLTIGTSVLPEEKFPEAWEADRAIDFLRAQKGRAQPWFLFVSMLKPHSEYVVPAPYDRMYPAKDMPLPRTFKPGLPLPEDFVAGEEAGGEGRRAKKRAKNDTGPGSPARLFINDPEILREVIGHYYGAVTLVDKHMGRVLAALDELGMRDDTIVVFTADHGNMLGERNRMFKGVMYESSARVPLLVRAPGVPAGRVNDAPVDNAALMPTLLDLAGMPVPAGIQGKSLAPVLRGRGPAPDAAYSYLGDKMVRQGDWKLIVPVIRQGAPELYNVTRDPDEQQNLYGRPEAAAAQAKLAALMQAWQSQRPPAVTLD